MSQIPNENDDNRSVAASDFVQLDQPDEVPNQDTQQQQQGQSQFGLHQNPPDWTMNTGSTHNNYQNVLKEQKLMIEKLEANIQTLQEKVKNLELEAKIRAMEENAEHNAKYQALEAKVNEVVQMLSTQKEEHHKEMDQLKDGFAKEMAQLESKNRKLEEKLISNVEVLTTKNGALEAKMEQLQTEFSKVFAVAEQQKQMMAQFQAKIHSLAQNQQANYQGKKLHIPIGNLWNSAKAKEILELKAEIRALKENAEQKAKDQVLETKCANLLSTQNERHKMEMEQLESKNRKLEENLSELQTKGTTENALEGKMEQLKNEFAAMLSDKMAALGTEIDESVKRAIDGNQLKLDNIWGQLMIKGKKIFANAKGNGWNQLKTKASISECGLTATGEGTWQYVFAMEGYPISVEQCRKENLHFPGTIVFYFELTSVCGWLDAVGFSDGNAGSHYSSTNSYAIQRCGVNENYNNYWLSGKQHKFEHPAVTTGFGDGDVVGSGLLLNSNNELTVFFTFNGQLLGKPTPINPTVDHLYPTFNILNISVEGNFGDNLVAKPFKFDIDKCPGLVFE